MCLLYRASASASSPCFLAQKFCLNIGIFLGEHSAFRSAFRIWGLGSRNPEFGLLLLLARGAQVLCHLSDIPGQPGSPAALLGVFSQLPGSSLIGISHFPDSGPEVLRSSIQFPWILKLRKLYPLKFLGLSEQETKPAKLDLI